MSEIKDLIDQIEKFREERDWKQFHNPKDTSISLVLEATEVMEHFQWKSKEEVESYIKTNKDEIAEELVDVLYWVLLISKDLNVNIVDAFKKKMEKNAQKYPIEKSKGKSTKYNKL